MTVTHLMPAATPEVSVIMPVFNGGKYLRQAMMSVLQQTFERLELVIVDDGSTDDSAEVINSVDDPRIKLIKHQSNLGITASRNRAISHATGNYLAMLDCDDFAFSRRLELQVNHLHSHPETGVVASWVLAENLDISHAKVYELCNPSPEPASVSSELLFSNFIIQSSVMVRRSVMPTDPYRDYDPAEDYDLWVRLSRGTRIDYIQQPLVLYRIHANNATVGNTTVQEAKVREINRLQLMELGLSPSDDQLSLHRQIGLRSIDPDLDDLMRIEQWLLTILAANKQAQIYPTQPLKKVVFNAWKFACSRLTERTPKATFHVLRSRLTRDNWRALLKLVTQRFY